MDASATLAITGLSRRHSRLAVPLHKRVFVSRGRLRARTIKEIRRIKVILAGDANEREQSVAASVGQSRAHALGTDDFSNGTDRPIRSNPFARSVGERGGQIDHARSLIDRGRL